MIALPTREVHLWWATASESDTEALQEAQAAVLSRAEQVICGRLAHDALRRAYVVSHALLRDVLSRYAPVPPQAWQFAPNPHGKPRIVEPEGYGWLMFNLAHAGPTAVVAVAHGVRVGVDIEAHGSLASARAAADVFMAPDEHRYVERDAAALLDLWTLKEAYLKACGRGLSVSLPSVRIGLDDPERPVLVTDPAGGIDPDGTCWLWRERARDHVVAVAVLSRVSCDFVVRQRVIVPLAPEHEA